MSVNEVSVRGNLTVGWNGPGSEYDYIRLSTGVNDACLH